MKLTETSELHCEHVALRQILCEFVRHKHWPVCGHGLKDQESAVNTLAGQKKDTLRMIILSCVCVRVCTRQGKANFPSFPDSAGVCE